MSQVPSGDGFIPLEEPLEAPGGNPAAGSTPTRPLPAAVSPSDLGPLAQDSRAIADVLARRAEQIARYGHTPEADARRPIHFFARELGAMAQAVGEDSQFGRPLPNMRRHVVTLAAFALAFIDRIDAEPPEKEDPFL